MDADQVASPNYRKVLQDTHAANPKWGGGGKYWAEVVIDFAKELGGVQSVLDYGCGQGILKQRLAGELLDVFEYDPGVVGKTDMPAPADIVVCTDVLEHIEPMLVYNVIRHLRKLTRKGAFLVISCGKSKDILADGRNAHLTIMPAEWWLAQLRGAGFIVLRHTMPKGLQVWLK